MSSGNRNDLRSRLKKWLCEQRPEAKNLKISEFSTPDAGASNETLLFEAEWQEDGRQNRHALVARLQPEGPGVFPEYDLSQQYKAMSLLADTDVPVPKLAGFEADPAVLGTPFFLMERIDGRVVTENPPYHMEGWFKELPPEQRGEIWRNGIRTIAQINRLDWRTLGFDYLNNPELGETPLLQQLTYYRNFLIWTEQRGRPYPKLHAVLGHLEARQPKDETIALCWGDSKIANLLIDGTNVVGVLDWEMVHLGNPVDDLAWWFTLDNSLSEGLELLVGMEVPKLSGLPSREEMIALWEKESGYSAEQLDYYELLGAFKYGVISASIGIKLTNAGIFPKEAEWDINNNCTPVLDRLIAAWGIRAY